MRRVHGQKNAERLLAVEAQKVTLLKEQITSRQDTLRQAEIEDVGLATAQQELTAELEVLQQQMSTLSDQLAHAVEHGNLQFATVEEFEGTIRSLESDTTLLTLGLHEATGRVEAS